jgi:membrane-bound ClpP family serine protease
MDNLTLAYVLIGSGIVLMLAEMVLPTGGLLFIPAAGVIIAGTALTFFHGEPYVGFATLTGVFIIVPIIGSLALKMLPYSPFGSKLDAPEDDVTVADMPGIQGLEQYAGRVGKAASPLRPAGIVEFDGRRVDCVSEGMMIDADSWVRCVAVRSGRVIVRQIDTPNPKAFENTDFA